MNDHMMYRTLFREYPDVVDVKQMCKMLGINVKAGYGLLHDEKIDYLLIGRSYRIPKIKIIEYLQNNSKKSPSVV